MTKSWHFWTVYLPRLVNVVKECPLSLSLSFSLLALNPQLKSYFLTRDHGPPHQLGILSCPIFRFLLEMACAVWQKIIYNYSKMFFSKILLLFFVVSICNFWISQLRDNHMIETNNSMMRLVNIFKIKDDRGDLSM